MKMTIRFVLTVPVESLLQIFEEQAKISIDEAHALFCTQIDRKPLKFVKGYYHFSSDNPYAFFKIAKIVVAIGTEAAHFQEESIKS